MSLLPVNHVLSRKVGGKCKTPRLRNAVIFNGVPPTFEWCDVHESSARRSNRSPVVDIFTNHPYQCSTNNTEQDGSLHLCHVNAEQNRQP